MLATDVPVIKIFLFNIFLAIFVFSIIPVGAIAISQSN